MWGNAALTLGLAAAASTVEGNRRHILGLRVVGGMQRWVETSTGVLATPDLHWQRGRAKLRPLPV